MPVASKKKIFVMIFLLFLVVVTMGTADRDIRVVLKQSEQPGAGVAGEVKLHGQSHALVIGIDDYTNGWPRLSEAVEDAQLVGQALEKQGFAVDLVKNPDADELEKRLKRFFCGQGR